MQTSKNDTIAFTFIYNKTQNYHWLSIVSVKDEV